MIERSPGHFKDWIRACKGGQPSCSDFSIAGPYVEWLLLGTIAARRPVHRDHSAVRRRLPALHAPTDRLRDGLVAGVRFEAALGVVTRFTLQYGGVTADFSRRIREAAAPLDANPSRGSP